MSSYQFREGFGADLGDSYQAWLDGCERRARFRDMVARPWLCDDPLDDLGRDHPELHPGVSVPCPDNTCDERKRDD